MPRVNPGPSRPSFETIDLFRAVAAIAVVYNHCFNLMLDQSVVATSRAWHAAALTASFGREAVIGFFVVSGFWIGRSIDRSFAGGRWSARDYLIARLSRLGIVLIPAMIAGGGLDVIGRSVLHLPLYAALHLDGGAPFDVASHLRLVDLIGNLAFLQDIVVPTWGSNGPLWTLACEAWYYMWYAVIVVAVRRRWSPSLVASLVVCVAIALLSFKVAMLFGCWLMGVAVYHLDHALRTRARVSLLWLIPALMFALVALAIARASFVGYLLGCYAIALGLSAVLLTALLAELATPRWLASLAAFGANASFSLYAVHLPILIFCIALGMPDHRLPGTPPTMLIVVMTTLMLTAGGWLFSRVTERHTERLRRRLRRLAGRTGDAVAMPQPSI